VVSFWNTVLANHSARSIALYLFVAILSGNLLCELGNLLAVKIRFNSHYFNTPLFILGIIGVFGFGIALLRRRSSNHHTDVGVK
jgi:hypothetical protein